MTSEIATLSRIERATLLAIYRMEYEPLPVIPKVVREHPDPELAALIRTPRPGRGISPVADFVVFGLIYPACDWRAFECALAGLVKDGLIELANDGTDPVPRNKYQRPDGRVLEIVRIRQEPPLDGERENTCDYEVLVDDWSVLDRSWIRGLVDPLRNPHRPNWYAVSRNGRGVCKSLIDALANDSITTRVQEWLHERRGRNGSLSRPAQDLLAAIAADGDDHEFQSDRSTVSKARTALGEAIPGADHCFILRTGSDKSLTFDARRYKPAKEAAP